MKRVMLLVIVSLALAGSMPGAETSVDRWGPEPLGARVEPAPFTPAPIKRQLHPTLKVHPARGNEVVLVQDGRPMCVLMVADQASAAARKAAIALQEALGKMSGGTVAIAKESELRLTKAGGRWSVEHRGRPVPSLVAIGETKLSAGEGLSGRELPLEGYRMKTVGNALLLVGSDVRPEGNLPLEGTRHAVSALLERHLDCRWLWPGDLGEIIPRRATVKIAALDEEDAPAIRQRKLRNYGYGGAETIEVPPDPGQPGSTSTRKLVLRHDRLTIGMTTLGLASDDYVGWCPQSTAWWSQQRLGSSYAVDAGHAYRGWWNRFGAEHPDWFALQRNGSRMPGRMPVEREKLCHANAGLIEQVIREKMAELKNNPGRDSVSVSPNDGGGNNGPCLCEGCRQLDPANGRPLGVDTYADGKRQTIPYVVLSDRMFTFYNRVAEGVAAVYPDRLLGTYAYASYRDLPLAVRPHPNLLIGFVGFGYWDDTELNADRQRWEQWAGVARNLFLRPNAFHQGHGMPGVFVTKLDRDIKHCYQTGMIATDFDSVLHHWGTQGLNYYVLAKLLWDPSQEAETIVQDYCDKGFGPAARLVRQYFRELEEVTNRCAAAEPANGKTAANELREEEQEGGSRHTKTYQRLARMYTAPVIARLRQILTEARVKVAADNSVQRRIDFLLAGLRYGELQAAVHAGMLANLADKSGLLRLLDERHAACRDIVRQHPFAVNMAYIAWREGTMWKKTGWKPVAGARQAASRRRAPRPAGRGRQS
ncbi:MAG: DUF4838 domain-containing protein [Opitutaceae bacterium]|nr:DUF4838 domain-containing protein [Opitutaceae bacterium]